MSSKATAAFGHGKRPDATAAASNRHGALVLIVGPSGAGKDTLIDGARAHLKSNPDYQFPKRFISRPSHPSEDFISIGEAEFDRAAAAGEFALNWTAHGTRYAIPARIDAALAEGVIVIANVSRTTIPSARERYDSVRVILIDCDPEVRAGRLAMRGRETEAEIVERLHRTVAAFDAEDADICIDNSGTPAQGITNLIETLEAIQAERR